MSEEDPFYDVLEDVKEQLQEISKPQNNGSPQQQQYLAEIKETIHDLKTSLQLVSQYLDASELSKREAEITSVENSYYTSLHRLNNQTATNNISDSIELQDPSVNMDTALENEDNQDKFNQLESQMLHEQDSQLDQISRTMQNLRKQANLMGEELQDHTDLLGSIDNNMDTVQGKLKRSSQKLQWIYEENKETYNTICMMVLIVALIILLFLTIIS